MDSIIQKMGILLWRKQERDHLKWDINVSILHIMEKLIIKQRISFNASFRWLQQQIIAYNLATSPNLSQVKMILEQAFTEEHYENTILHSDKGRRRGKRETS